MKVRVIALLDGAEVPAWQTAALRKISESQDLILVSLLFGNKRSRGPGINRLLYWYGLLDRRMFPYRPDALKKSDLSVALPGIPCRSVTFEDVGDGSSRLSPADVESTRVEQPDVILYFGDRRLTGDLLSVPISGLWDFSLGETHSFGRSEPVLRELMADSPVVRSAMHVVSKDAENRGTLSTSYSRVHKLSLHKGRNISLWKSASLPVRKLRDLARLGADGFRKSSVKSPPEFVTTPIQAPGIMTSLVFLFRQCWRVVRALMVKAFFFDQWTLAFSLGNGFGTSFQNFQVVTPPRDRFWADPHILKGDNGWHVFLEEYLYASGRGHISVMTIGEDGSWTTPRPVLKQDYHLSYPFVFSWEGVRYMIPETSKNRTIELYECTDFPDSWVLKRILMNQVRAVDATLLHDQNRWWLFANMAEQDGAETTDELFLFSSDDFLEGSWTPHPLNPIVSDCRTARPAGRVFEYQGEMYRPSQDCSEEYGGGINFNRITRLTEQEYEEVLVDSYKPRWDKNIFGLHSYAIADGLKVVDLCVKRRKW
jgi:hypothetical protein